MQLLARIRVDHAEQRWVMQVQVRLVERDLRGVTGELFLESVAGERAVVFRVERFVLPDEWVVHVGAAERVRAAGNDSIGMAAQIAVHSLEFERLRRREREARGD